LEKQKVVEIKGARLHNLKSIDVMIKRNAFTVITGVSGSGKSSLAFDTLFAEGQRRYIESLSAYARQFMGKLQKPQVDYIKGLSPSIAIQQKVNTRNPRSTVATSTELYDYLKLLFARVGKTFSPVSNKEVQSHSVTDVLDYILAFSMDEGPYQIYLLAPVKADTREALKAHLLLELKKGFTRMKIGEKLHKIEKILEDEERLKDLHAVDMYLMVDRMLWEGINEDDQHRLADSIQTSFWEGQGDLYLEVIDKNGNEHKINFNNRFELDGIEFERPSVNFLSFNSPYGACKKCEGFGTVIGVDEDLVIPDDTLSIFEGCVAPWRGQSLNKWQQEFTHYAAFEGFPIHKAYGDLSVKDKDLLWQGKGNIKGINQFFDFLQEQSYKIQYRVMMSRYKGKTKCPECRGSRIRKDAEFVKIVSKAELPNLVSESNRFSISEVLALSIKDAAHLLKEVKLSEEDWSIGKRLLTEILTRLSYLQDVGLDYLGLNRKSNSLSGGESQRINLATSLGSNLTGSTYILDEPSIGLHSRDTVRLIKVLRKLKEQGNTVVVVEHDEEIMEAADEIIDIGPFAGIHGGEIVFQGDFSQLEKSESLTSQYLTGRELIELPSLRRKWNNFIHIHGAKHNNLKNFDTKVPLGVFTVVTGVSGSGKTSLIKGILYPAVLNRMENYAGAKEGDAKNVSGDFSFVNSVEMIDQNPIGKSSRSNPVTYVKAYDGIRELFASQPLAKQRGYKSSFFSFNVEGGRCDNCKGEGEEVVEMQFMADLHLQCDVCKGKRFKEELLEVTYKNKSISDVLEMSIEEAHGFFEEQKTVKNKLKTLLNVGLGYLSMGQSSATLSGGEAQRVKLAYFLSKSSNAHTMFIFDEPTTGLHFHDVKKLLQAFNALIEKGNTIVTIEHHPDVIKSADWIIDLGPDGGDLGGDLVFEGTPEDIVKEKKSITGHYLKSKLN
jgi:excinuclease ABC subunit A